MSNLKPPPLFLTPQTVRGMRGVGHPKRVVQVPVESMALSDKCPPSKAKLEAADVPASIRPDCNTKITERAVRYDSRGPRRDVIEHRQEALSAPPANHEGGRRDDQSEKRGKSSGHGRSQRTGSNPKRPSGREDRSNGKIGAVHGSARSANTQRPAAQPPAKAKPNQTDQNLGQQPPRRPGRIAALGADFDILAGDRDHDPVPSMPREPIRAKDSAVGDIERPSARPCDPHRAKRIIARAEDIPSAMELRAAGWREKR